MLNYRKGEAVIKKMNQTYKKTTNGKYLEIHLV